MLIVRLIRYKYKWGEYGPDNNQNFIRLTPGRPKLKIMATQQDERISYVNPKETQLQVLQEKFHCPQTQKQVIKLDFHTLNVPGGQATWWHCPACQGWHVIIET